MDTEACGRTGEKCVQTSSSRACVCLSRARGHRWSDAEHTLRQLAFKTASASLSWTRADKHTQLPTEKANPVVVTQAMKLVFVETDEAIVLVILVDHVSGLVGRFPIKRLRLDKGNGINE